MLSRHLQLCRLFSRSADYHRGQLGLLVVDLLLLDMGSLQRKMSLRETPGLNLLSRTLSDWVIIRLKRLLRQVRLKVLIVDQPGVVK